MLGFYGAGFLLIPRCRFSVKKIFRSTLTILAIKILLVETTDPTVYCQGDSSTWTAGFGGCDGYVSTGRFHRFCNSDTDSTTGLTAEQACPECEVCTPPPTTTLTTSTTATTTTSSATTVTTITTTLMTCQGDHLTWTAGFGFCNVYGPGGRFHVLCDSDVDSNPGPNQGLTAEQACPDCGLCEPPPTTTVTTTTSKTSTTATTVTTSTTTVTKEFCKGYHTSWTAGFGGCGNYALGGRFHFQCDNDIDSTPGPNLGLTATEACPDCGVCEPPPTTTVTTSTTTTTVTTTSTSISSTTTTKFWCQGTQETWTAGYGNCDVYAPDQRFHNLCSSDTSDYGLTATQVCPECGSCRVPPSTTTTTTTTTTSTTTTLTTSTTTTTTTTTTTSSTASSTTSTTASTTTTSSATTTTTSSVTTTTTTALPPTSPPGSCWVLIPSGCPRQLADFHPSWTRDPRGGWHKTECLQNRKIDYDTYCNTTDTVMHYVPEMVRDPKRDGRACGDPTIAEDKAWARVFDLRGADANEDNCTELCDEMASCRAYSGHWDEGWCIGCKVPLKGFWNATGAVAFKKSATDAPTQAPTPSPTAAPTMSPTPPPTQAPSRPPSPPPTPEIKLEFIVENLEYDAMTERQKTKVTSIIQTRVATNSGVAKKFISVSLSEGSVAVDVTIRVPERMGAVSLKKTVAMKEVIITDFVVADVRAIPDLPTTGTLRVRGYSISILMALPRKRPRPTPSPPRTAWKEMLPGPGRRRNKPRPTRLRGREWFSSRPVWPTTPKGPSWSPDKCPQRCWWPPEDHLQMCNWPLCQENCPTCFYRKTLSWNCPKTCLTPLSKLANNCKRKICEDNCPSCYYQLAVPELPEVPKPPKRQARRTPTPTWKPAPAKPSKRRARRTPTPTPRPYKPRNYKYTKDTLPVICPTYCSYPAKDRMQKCSWVKCQRSCAHCGVAFIEKGLILN